MSKEDSSTGPFRPISLSPTDKKLLQVITQTILKANLDRYQRFWGADDGKVNPSAWKLVKSKDQVQVYHKRQVWPSRTSFQVPEADTTMMQSMLCVGLTSGKLEDLMPRLVAQTPGATNDLSRASVLSTLKEPTPTKPFRSVAVKWAELDVRLKSMGLVMNHDYVYAEAAGVRRLPSGERVGYHLMHSIGFPGAHALPGRVRAQLSVCSFFRQVNETSVSIYVMGMMDSLNGRTQRVIVPHFVKMLLSLSKRPHCDKTRSSVTETSGKHNSKMLGLAPGHTCITCSKRLWRFGSFSLHHGVCNVCSENVCSSCKIVKELSFVTSDLQMTQRNAIFCSSCASDADAYGFSKTENSIKLRRKLRSLSKRFGE